MQVGFIGIGVMGRPMTLNLLKAKHTVSIFARHPEKPVVQEVINAGAKLAPSPRADLVFVDQRPAILFAESMSECAFPPTCQAFHYDQLHSHLSISSFSQNNAGVCS